MIKREQFDEQYSENIDSSNNAQPNETLTKSTNDGKKNSARNPESGNRKERMMAYLEQSDSDSYFDDVPKTSSHEKSSNKQKFTNPSFAKMSKSADSDDSLSAFKRMQRIFVIGDCLDFCLLPLWNACIQPCFGCFSHVYNSMFPNEEEIIDNDLWSWSPEDISEVFLYFALFSFFVCALIHLIGEVCIAMLPSSAEWFLTNPRIMAPLLTPIVCIEIVGIFLMSKHKMIHILHFEAPILMIFSASLLLGSIVCLAEHSELKMELKCLSEQREIDEVNCRNWFGAWRMCLVGSCGMVIFAIVLAFCSYWRRNSIIALQHLNYFEDEELIRPPHKVDIE